MKVNYFYVGISSVAFVSALLFFAIYNQLILFQSPWNVHNIVTASLAIQKKQVTMYYYYGDK